MHYKLLLKMGISGTLNCLFCKTETETIELMYIECDNVKNIWKVTEDWVRMIYYVRQLFITSFFSFFVIDMTMEK